MNLIIQDIQQEQNLGGNAMSDISGGCGYGFGGYHAFQYNPYVCCAPPPPPVSCCVQFHREPRIKYIPHRPVRKNKVRRNKMRLVRR